MLYTWSYRESVRFHVCTWHIHTCVCVCVCVYVWVGVGGWVRGCVRMCMCAYVRVVLPKSNTETVISKNRHRLGAIIAGIFGTLGLLSSAVAILVVLCQRHRRWAIRRRANAANNDAFWWRLLPSRFHLRRRLRWRCPEDLALHTTSSSTSSPTEEVTGAIVARFKYQSTHALHL